MSHWFTGWKFWPERPQGPVGSDYRQVKWVRPYRPGPIRVLVTLLGVVATTLPALLALVAALSGGAILVRLVYTVALGLIATGLGIAVIRFYTVGVYVNDAGVRVARMRSMTVFPWRLIVDVSRSSRDTLVITVRDVGPLATPLSRRSIDFVGRLEAFDMAALAVERWWRDTRS